MSETRKIAVIEGSRRLPSVLAAAACLGVLSQVAAALPEPQPAKEMTDRDHKALAAAQQKRERRAAKLRRR